MRNLSMTPFQTLHSICATLLLIAPALAQESGPHDDVLEALPDEVIATMEARDRWFAALPQAEDGGTRYFFVEDLLRWDVGDTVTVAFLGGSPDLHEKVADATRQITDACNIKFDFGRQSDGTYRSWSTADTGYSADIRVSFDMRGNFSLVGRDSVNSAIGMPAGPVGGRANQRSLNLGGFHILLPPEWKRTVRHEFLHALAFHHEHQSPLGGCDSQFRWEDEPGYMPTQDANGRFISDADGRRPGIYTYLSGYPNYWNKSKVDHNLRQATSSSATTAGSFDRASIMLYRFLPLFYKTSPSPCAPSGGTQDLSAGDLAGLQHLYPDDSDAESIESIAARHESLVDGIRKSTILDNLSKQDALELIEGRGKE